MKNAAYFHYIAVFHYIKHIRIEYVLIKILSIKIIWLHKSFCE